MKALPLVLAAGGLWVGLASSRQADQIVILSGDTQGYLSPCGCSAPMMGGIRRRAAAIRLMSEPGHTTILDNGGFVDRLGRQSELKAETVAETMAELGAAAINIGPMDAALGRGELLQLAQLSGGRIVSLSLASQDIEGTKISGPFLVGGATETASAVAAPLGATPITLDDAVRNLVEAAHDAGLAPVLMLQGGHDTALRLAREFPTLALIQYSSVGNPPPKLEMAGGTALATTGEHGKHIVKLVYRNGKFSDYKSVALGPEFKDDPTVSRYYSAYLRRVDREKLLEQLPRHKTDGFAGSWTCGKCHQGATHVWKQSAHRKAYETLESQGHGRDPDCVPCHVVGLDSTQGFRSKATTPELAGVGCESCHGPALAHARRPTASPLARLTSNACVGCHNPENSPYFDFEIYWRKIRHK